VVFHSSSVRQERGNYLTVHFYEKPNHEIQVYRLSGNDKSNHVIQSHRLIFIILIIINDVKNIKNLKFKMWVKRKSDIVAFLDYGPKGGVLSATALSSKASGHSLL